MILRRHSATQLHGSRPHACNIIMRFMCALHFETWSLRPRTLSAERTVSALQIKWEGYSSKDNTWEDPIQACAGGDENRTAPPSRNLPRPTLCCSLSRARYVATRDESALIACSVRRSSNRARQVLEGIGPPSAARFGEQPSPRHSHLLFLSRAIRWRRL